MFFIGSQAKNIEATVKGILKDYFTEALSGEPYSETFAAWHGVDVLVHGDGEAAGRKPFARFEKSGCTPKVWRKKLDESIEVGEEHQWQFTVTVMADEQAGAIPDTTEPTASQQLLGDALMNLVNSNESREALDNIGLERAKLVPENEAEGQEFHFGTYTLTFSTFSLSSIPDPTP